MLFQINTLQTWGTGDTLGERAKRGCLKFAMEEPPRGAAFLWMWVAR